MSMLAAAVRDANGPYRLVLESRPVPSPRRGEVLVRVRASSLNARDLMMLKDFFRPDDGRVPLSDGVGEVVDCGPGVANLKVGDKVMSLFFPLWRSGRPEASVLSIVTGHQVDGFAAEFACVPAACLTSIPSGWSFAEAATLPCAGLTAWRALVVEGQLKAGQTLVVQGTGGVSLFAATLGLALGARVIVTTSSLAKVAQLKELGVEDVINYNEMPEWGREVERINQGRGADIVLEIGGAGTMNQSVAALAVGGKILMVGTMAGWSGEFQTAGVIVGNITMKGITVGSRAHQRDMVRFLSESELRPCVEIVMPFPQMANALALMESQNHIGKICLKIAD